MHPFIFTSVISLFLTLVAAVPAAAPVRPPAGGVNLTSLVVDMAIAKDNSAMTIIFDNFQAADGPSAGKTKSRAFCRVTIGVNSPGWAFDISSADFRGYVNLDKGAEASLVTRWKYVDLNGVDLKGKVKQ
jgi:hypothetical protein